MASLRNMLLRPVAALAIMGAMSLTPLTAYADSPLTLSAEMPFLGTVVTPAVTAPILIGGILYVPGPATGGAAGTVPTFLGTVQTDAVTAPILIGGILYVP